MWRGCIGGVDDAYHAIAVRVHCARRAMQSQCLSVLRICMPGALRTNHLTRNVEALCRYVVTLSKATHADTVR